MNDSDEFENGRRTVDYLNDILPADAVEDVKLALREFPEVALPVETTVYKNGEIQRENVARFVTARLHSEFLFGTSYLQREIVGEPEDPEEIILRVLHPKNVVLDDEGEILDEGEQDYGEQ